MNADEALTLERDDVCLYQSQLYLVTEAFGRGYMLRLRGQQGNTEVPAAKCLLVYRKDAVPPGFTVTPLNDEQEAQIRAVIAARLERERQAQQEGQG